MAQKACDGEPYLRSGAAETAVPPAGMTNLPWFLVGRNATSEFRSNSGLAAKGVIAKAAASRRTPKVYARVGSIEVASLILQAGRFTSTVVSSSSCRTEPPVAMIAWSFTVPSI